MRTLISGIGLITIGMLLNVGAPQSVRAAGAQGIQPETAQEQKDKQLRLDQQNLQERQRLEAPSLKDRNAEIPPYKENQAIGGQKQAGPTDFPQPAFPFVKGQLMQIEGNFYVLKDAEGKDVRVHVDKGTKMDGAFHVGDILEVQRTLQGHAVTIKRASSPLTMPPASASSGTGPGSSDRIIKDEQVSLSGLKIEGDNYLIKDGHGNEVRLMVNPNTRMFCSQASSFSSMLPAPSASDKPDLKGQPQDLARTAEQPGSEVGPGTKTGKEQAAVTGECGFKKGDMIEAEISDMGAATFIKLAGRPQPGQPLP